MSNSLLFCYRQKTISRGKQSARGRQSTVSSKLAHPFQKMASPQVLPGELKTQLIITPNLHVYPSAAKIKTSKNIVTSSNESGSADLQKKKQDLSDNADDSTSSSKETPCKNDAYTEIPIAPEQETAGSKDSDTSAEPQSDGQPEVNQIDKLRSGM